MHSNTVILRNGFSNKHYYEVGIVLPVYNQQREYVFKCLYSIQNQEYRDFHLIIVIDGANQDTIEAILTCSNNLTIPLKIIRRNENKGIAYSLNESFASLNKCKYLTWISSDNIYYSNYLKDLVKALDSEPKETILCYSLFKLINEYGESIKLNREQEQQFIKFMDRPKIDIYQHSFIGASFLFKKEAFDKTDKYNSEYEKVEDYEFWIRLLQIGEIKFVKEYLMEYRLGGRHSYTTITPREEILFKSIQASIKHQIQNRNIPKVSILLCGYNQENYIVKSIVSALYQTFTDFQLLLLDDASVDNTPIIMNRFYDSRITNIQLSKNIGKAAIMNIGLKYALGEYILELDGDDWLEPQALEVMVNEIEKLPNDVALVYANRKIWFQKDQEIIEGPVYKGFNYSDKYEVLAKMKTHCPRLYRKSALEAVGAWPSKVINRQKEERCIVDDYYIMVILAKNYKFHWIDEILYNQRRHGKNITVNENLQCRKQLKSVVKKMLVKWGNFYRPDFLYEGQWIGEVKLIKKIRVPKVVRIKLRKNFNTEKNLIKRE